METKKLRCTAAGLLVALCAASSNASGNETVVKLTGAPPGHTVWQITQPTVNAKQTDYPQITFSSGETVTVTASGCVQTGGHGETWKRYVDPAGSDSGTLYHGQLWIPGAMTGLQFFQPRQPAVYTIPAGAPLPSNQNHLILGYTDNNYPDNGYASRNSDNGNFNQCWGLGDAAVTIDIQSTAPTVAPPASASYTFKLENVTIRNLRSKKSDTDLLASTAVINGTQAQIGQTRLGDLQQGSHDISFLTEIDEVAPTDRINFAYTIANSGSSDAQTVDNALAGIIGKIAPVVVPDKTTSALIALAAQAWTVLFNLLDPDCDGPVVADSISATGADLASWTQAGPLTRTVSFVGSNSASGCGSNSFYEVTYSIAPGAAPQPYSLKIDAKSRATAAGAGTTLLQPH